ncbi:MAG: ABC transporter permease [Promethearchaeota archaeon]
MASVQDHNQNDQTFLTPTIQKTQVGAKRSLIQIEKTVKFELLKNFGKFMAMLLTSLFIFILFLVINEIQEYNGSPTPDDPADYFQSYLMMISFLILIISSTFAGSIIAEDFEKQTGNLLFPKISKDRLLIGRIIARYLYIALSIGFYYLIVGIYTFIKYNGVPKIVWGSMGWALLYAFLLFAFITFLSAILKRSSTAVITGILVLLIIFPMLRMILMFTGVTVEPLFILTYFGDIITVWFNMPPNDARFVEMAFGRGPMADPSNTYMSWITPSAAGAVIGVIIYSVILFGAAYIIFRRRQNKS